MMAKNKPTATELRNLFTEMMLNSYYHLQCIDKEILALDIKNLSDATEDQKNKLHALTMTFVLINDLIHQGHNISKKLLKKDYLPLIDSYMRRHQTSIEQKLVDPCKCIACGVSDEAQEDQETKN
jgi:hypothetical protein